MSQPTPSRRDLLRMLAAAVGAAALSTVPTQWETPIVEIGALPAHAQTSSTRRFRVFPRWVDTGHPYTANQCTFVNGTHIEGRLLRLDGSVITGMGHTAIMHLWIEGVKTAPYAYPGVYREFPAENDGRWNADIPKRPTKFTWHIFLSALVSGDPISDELVGVSDGVDDCGKPGTKNLFVADWIFQ